MSWTDHGPVSVPPQTVVYGAAIVVALAALGGVGFGFRAGWRDAGRPALAAGDQTQAADTAIIAKPIVDISAIEQQAPPDAASNSASPAAEAAEATNDIAAKTAAAQAAQSKPSQGAVDIDDIVASSTEKPQAPAKPTTDEQAPKSDVPF